MMDGTEQGGEAGDHFDLAADLAEIPRALAWLNTVAVRDHWPARADFALQMCLEEALVNVISHGLTRAADDSDAIVLTYHRSPDLIRVTVADRGAAFDPTAATVSALPASVETAVIGGHGIRLMRKMLDEFSYERIGEENRLTLGCRTGAG